MIDYVYLILVSHIILIFGLLIIYLIELLINKMLIVRWFYYKKSLYAAKGTADRDSVLYFIFQMIFAYYLIKHYKNVYDGINFFVWGIIILIFSILVRILYMKFQGIDESKEPMTKEEIKEGIKENWGRKGKK